MVVLTLYRHTCIKAQSPGPPVCLVSTSFLPPLLGHSGSWLRPQTSEHTYQVTQGAGQLFGNFIWKLYSPLTCNISSSYILEIRLQCLWLKGILPITMVNWFLTKKSRQFDEERTAFLTNSAQITWYSHVKMKLDPTSHHIRNKVYQWLKCES